jgi:hypothetical protein
MENAFSLISLRSVNRFSLRQRGIYFLLLLFIMFDMSLLEPKNVFFTAIEKSGMKDIFFAQKLDITRQTFAKKKFEPHTFSIEELLTLADLLRYDWKELIQDIITEKQKKPELYIYKK